MQLICMIYALLSLYLFVFICPHIMEVNAVHEVRQYIFSCEESMCWVFIIYPLSPVRASKHTSFKSLFWSSRCVHEEGVRGKKSSLALHCFCNTLLIRLLVVSFTRSHHLRLTAARAANTCLASQIVASWRCSRSPRKARGPAISVPV